MFKRKLFKRALPFILSVAMMFESLPATAMATESSGAEQMTETEALDEEGGEAGSEKESGSEEKSEPVSASEAEAESGSLPESESGSEPKSEEKSELESKTAETGGSEAESGSETKSEEPSRSESESESGSETEPGSESKPEDEEETAGIEEKEADAEETAPATKLDLNDKIGTEDDNLSQGDFFRETFTRVYGELPLTFATEYRNSSRCGEFQENLKEYIDILVDDEKVHDTAKANFSFKWTGKKDGAEGADAYTEAVDGVPVNVGEYKLHITLAEEKDVWTEASMDVYVKIQPAELELVLEKAGTSILKIDPGKTVKDLKDQITKDYELKYKKSADVSLDKDAIVEKFALTVREAGSETDLEDTAILSAKTGYEVRITIDFKEKTNYNVTTEQYYKVEVDDLQETRVEVALDGVAYPVTKVYGDSSTALTDLFAKTAKVFVVDKDGDDKELTAAEGETLAVPGWYRREQVPGSDEDGIQEDGSICYAEEPELKYVKLAEGETPEEAGEYYVIWVYAGDDKNAYKASASDPVAATIEPAPVAITIANDADSINKLFHEGMEEEDIKEALTHIDYKVSTYTADGKVDTASDVKTDDFFGVTYAGDAEEQKEQYYKPVFELQRAIIEYKQQNKKLEEKDWEWNPFEEKLVKEDDGHVYEYRVAFTGQKGIYNTDGKITEIEPVTNVATNAANRNYLAKVDTKTLDEQAVRVNMDATKEAVIDYDPIVKAFNDTYKYPTVGTGEADSPAVKVYDENALFANRAAYKQAQVKDGSNVVASATDGLTYTWKSLPLDEYDQYMEKTPEQKEENPLENEKWQYVTGDDLGSTEVDNGDFVSTAPANVYQLTIEYKDPEHNYWAKPQKVYFKVERQQIVIVPGSQVAQDGQQISNWRDILNAVPGLDKSFAKVYKIPNNVKTEYDAVGEDKSSLEVTLSAQENSKIQYEVQNKEKNADGTNKDNYVKTTHNVFDNKVGKYEYGVVATLAPTFNDIDKNGDPIVVSNNYTTQYESEGVKEDYTELSEIKFIGEGRLYVDIDMTKIPQDKQYDGEAITLPDGLVKIYSDQDMKNEVTSEILNTTSEYDPEKVNLYWSKAKVDKEGNRTDLHEYTTEDVIWGGEYTLALRFKGNETYRPITEKISGTTEEPYYTYGDTKVYKNENNDYTFKITPRDITITPQVKTDVKAGETVDKLLVDALTVEGDLVEKDRVFFEHAEFAIGTFGDHYIKFDKENGYFPDESKYQYDKIDKYGGYPAFAGYKPLFNYQVNDKDEIKDVDKTYLRFGSKYAVKLDNALNTPLAESYNVTWNPAALTVSERGQGKVTATVGQEHSIALKYAFDGSTYTIKPREAAKFLTKEDGSFTYYDIANNKMESEDYAGNYISYRIYAPKEFEGTDFKKYSGRFFYAEAIANAGGYLLMKDWSNTDADGLHYIEVLFPVTEDDKVRSFNITWEEGYTETFQFEGVELEADLTKAVAPKSIAFNGVQSKMAVGETQQLDVKITKRQLGDVIKLQYRIAGTANETKNQFISVDPDTGIVTALHTEKKATTQIEAYPVYLENGKYVEITGKGVKTAKTKITVTDVTAPSIKKVIPQDETVKVQFTDAGNGYRREIYVIEAKKAKVTDFESRIAGMQNNQWEKAGFAVAPVYSYATSATKEKYDTKTKTITETVTGLVPGTNYVVYVRNVSAARKLDDGSQVDLSFKGAVKNFVAVKSQVQDLEPYFNVDPETNTPIGKSAVKYLEYIDPETGKLDFKKSIDNHEYEVELLSKSAQISVNGLFFEKYDGNTAAEDKDKRRYALPLTKPLQANYYNPKLTYGIFDSRAIKYDEEQSAWIDVDPWENNYDSSKFATISNKGKISLKATSWDGQKTVYIYVKADTTDETVFGWVSLTIKATPTSVTGKKAKLKVGDDRQLAEFLQYKQGNKKIPEYKSSQISISDDMIEAAAEAGYKIYDRDDDWVTDGDQFNWNTRPWSRNWHIVAMSPNKAPFRLTVTDRTADGTEMTATVTLTAAALDPVKNLKKAYVDDKNITINFKHAGNPYGYEIALMDARKNVVSKKFVYAVPKYEESNIKPHEQKRQSWIVAKNFNDVTKEWDRYELEYFAKTDTFAYTIHNDKLVRLSSYTVSVTPVYDAQKGKTVTTKVKTTNIPAARNYNVDAMGEAYRGGINILHTYANFAKGVTPDKDNTFVMDELAVRPYFQSGNTYTLVADDTDKTWSKDRTTDKLTWKSSNTKVATIKANPGTYTATFKALKAGDTTISVTSKITKKVIARYDVRVKAVGNGNGFAGGYEPTGDDNFYKNILAQWDPFYDGRLEVLSATDMLTVNADSTYDRTWVSFTAPNYGQYTFEAMAGTNAINIDAYNGKNGNLFTLTNNTAILEAGQKIYFRFSGSFTLKVLDATDFARLTIANTAENPLEVRSNASGWIAFTAHEDNVYRFMTNKEALIKTGDTEYVTIKKNNIDDNTSYKFTTKQVDDKDAKKGYVSDFECGLNAGETVYIKVNPSASTGKDLAKLWVEWREVETKNILLMGSNETATDKLSKDHRTAYAKFTALETGKYTFSTEAAKAETGKDDAGKSIYAEIIDVKLYEANGIDEVGTYDLLNDSKSAIAALNAEDDSVGKNTFDIYMNAGRTVIIKFAVKDNQESIKHAFGDLTAEDQSKNDKKDKTYDVKVTVNSDAGKWTALALDKAETVTKDTTKTFKFEVPENGQYVFTPIDGAEVVKYFDKKYKELKFEEKNVLLVKDNSNVKASDTIYVEVKAGSDKDGKIEVSQVKVTALTAGAAPDSFKAKGTKNADRWYSFTATEEGVYTFSATAVSNDTKDADGNVVKKSGHTTIPKEYEEAFGNEKPSAQFTQSLKPGQKVVYKVSTTLGLEPTDTTPEADVETTINVSVKQENPDPITVGSIEKTITNADDELLYKFVAVDTDSYTIEWKMKENTTVDAKIGYTKDLTDLNDLTPVGSKISDIDLIAGNTIYIKVKPDAANASGTLSITADKSNVKPLKSGVPSETFTFEKNKNSSQSYQFIAPVDAKYSAVVKLEENAGSVDDLKIECWDYLPSNTPSNTKSKIEVSKKDGYWYMSLQKGRTIKITLKTNLVPSVDVKGTLTIQPETPADAKPMGASQEVKPALGKNEYYSYTIPASGRYSFTLTNADVTVGAQKKALNSSSNKDEAAKLVDAMTGEWFNKNDVVYLTVSTTKAAEQTATLKVEAIKDVETLPADGSEKEITIPKNAHVFYQFKAPEYGRYDFTNMTPVTVEKDGVSTTQSVASDIRVYQNDDVTNKALTNKGSITLNKDELVFIVMSADSKDNVQFKYAVTKTPVTQLKVSDTPTKVKVKEGTPAEFEFPILNEGMYAFSIVGEGMSVKWPSENASKTVEVNGNELFAGNPENATYVVKKYKTTNAVQKFTVSYTKPVAPEAPQDDAQVAEAEVSITVKKVEPVVLKADDAEKSIEINKGECAIVSFIPAVSNRYAFTTGNDNVYTKKNGFVEKVFTVNDKDNNEPYETIVLAVKDTDENKKETAKVKVTTVKQTPITESPAAFKATGKEQILWYEYKADKDARYDFEVTNGKDAQDEKVDYVEKEQVTIQEFKNIRDEAPVDKDNLSSKLMKKDDTVLIRVTVTDEVAKDAEVKFNIKKTEGVFKEVVFTPTSEKDIPITFTAKKDELYTLTVEPKSAMNYQSVKVVYTDKDGKEQTLEDLKDTELNIDKDTEVSVTIGLSEEPKKDIVFYIFVDKKAKPAPEPSKPETPDQTPETPEA